MILPTNEENLKKVLYDQQLKLLEEMQKKGYNVVTCGHCGVTLLHRTKKEDDLTCCECLTEQELSDAPDLFY